MAGTENPKTELIYPATVTAIADVRVDLQNPAALVGLHFLPSFLIHLEVELLGLGGFFTARDRQGAASQRWGPGQSLPIC